MPATDPWFGKDKLKHLIAGFAITLVVFAAALWFHFAFGRALLVGALAGVAAGAAKELLYDLALHALTHGDPSWRDFTVTCVGALLGAGAALLGRLL